MKNSLFMDLSLFADAGTLTNATTQYINAYTGDVTAFDSNNTLTPTMKTFYDTELLENHRDQLIFAQLGRKQGLPARRGRTIEWRKWNTLPLCSELTEGVIPTGKKMGMTSINVALAQYGEYVAVTDILELHALDDVIAGAIEELGAAGGKTHDLLVRNVLMTGTNILFADIYDGTTYSSTPSTKSDLITGITSYTANLTPD
ncbi:MAG: N4-gp56 family major capsid protein, partial [Clostridia bacterium]|nr:N4-gp56 family major capsid protein [Clostridia bacterium]